MRTIECPCCEGARYMQANDATGRTRGYACKVCDGAGHLDADADLDALKVYGLAQRARLDNANEEIVYWASEGQQNMGAAVAEQRTFHHKLGARAAERNLGLARAAWLAVRDAARQRAEDERQAYLDGHDEAY